MYSYNTCYHYCKKYGRRGVVNGPIRLQGFCSLLEVVKQQLQEDCENYRYRERASDHLKKNEKDITKNSIDKLK